MEKPNPNSHEQRPKSWLELPLDLLILVFERLAFTDFQRGKSVCSSWYSASRQSLHKKNKSPWLIVFPGKEDDEYYCTLFNPGEKNKRYKTKGFGLGFATSDCKAIYGNWLLMQDPEFNLYIVNLFTQESFNLPSSKLQIRLFNIRSIVFWIDEKTKDYLVVLGLHARCAVYFKKGDSSWKQIPKSGSCRDMVYKDHKLYFLSDYHDFKIFDFSGEDPQETFQCRVFEDPVHCKFTTKLVVTVTGDVLKVDKLYGDFGRYYDNMPRFHIYKVYSSELLVECEKVDSLGKEAIFFHQGITLLASDIEGFNINSIYLDGGGASAPYVFFNLGTQKMERLRNFGFLSYVQLAKARWFLPSFMHI